MNNNYNLYIAFGTLPALFSQINIFLDKDPSYVWVRSAGNFSKKEYLINNLKYYYKFDCSDLDYINNEYKDIEEQVKNILLNDKKARFTVFTDDVRCHYFLKPLILAGAYDRVDKMILLSDGNITLDNYLKYNSHNDNILKEKWDNIIDNIKNNINIDNYLNEYYFGFWLSIRKDVEYLTPCPEVISNSENKFNIKLFDIKKRYKRLNSKQKDLFFGDHLLNNKIKNILNNKKNILIITGTYNFGSPEITNFIYKDLINQVLIDYRNDYKILFKPHPIFAHELNDEFNNFLVDRDIEIMPVKMPLELILWERDDIYIGGFCSTSFVLINKKNVKFLFGEPIGFSRFIFKNIKTYNIQVSQDMAILFKESFGKNEAIINGINNRIDIMTNNLKSELDKIINITESNLYKDNNINLREAIKIMIKLLKIKFVSTIKTIGAKK